MTGTEGQRTDDAAPSPKDAGDDAIRGPLWLWRPEHRAAVMHERRRRFGSCPNDDDE